VADLDRIDKARKAVTERAELPGMSLMEHLTELRKRLLHSVAWVAVGVVIAYIFHVRLIEYIQRPLVNIGLKMTMTHPTDALNFLIKTSVVVGIIIASPFVLYQIWLFISPGMYAHEKKYVVPFMTATVGLFLAGAWFGYRWVLPGAMTFLIQDIGKNFSHMITIEDYTQFCFELPILMFFLALFGVADGKFFLRQWRYAVLIIFLVSAIICPLQDPFSMCLFASPMLLLYIVGVGTAFLVHPDRRKAREAKMSA
jgi:sec-independent protein translocase protein TatC